MEPIGRVITAVILFILWILEPLYAWRAGQKKKVPPFESPVLSQSATSIAESIRNKQISAVEVVKEYIKRCKEVNPVINAIVDDRFIDAFIDAQKVDEYLKENKYNPEELKKTKPLLGVPVTIKESCRVKGLSLCGGTNYRRGIKATEDSIAVERLKEAGAIVLCVSNTPEYCMSFESTNKVTGVSRNPYDSTKTVGGSSGGEGALLGSGASVIGVGSDLGGSTRIPALFNGIFGHKPTTRLIPVEDHFPIGSDEITKDYATFGPMTRYAEDLPLLMKIMAGDKASVLRLDQKVDLSKIKVYHMEESEKTMAISAVRPEIKEKIRQSVQFLNENCGSKVMDYKFDLSSSFESFAAALNQLKHMPNMFETNPKKNDNFWVEFFKSMFGLSNYTFNSLFSHFSFRINAGIPHDKMPFYLKKTEDLKKDFKDVLGDDGVFIFPTLPIPAFYHNQCTGRMSMLVYTLLANVLCLPATSVPVGLNKDGLPIAVQVIAGPNQDRLCFAVAKALEKQFGGWRPPC